MRRFASFGLSSLVLMLLSIAAPARAAAAVWVVDDDGMGNFASCDAADAAFTTIPPAISAAGAGDTISVCPGTYAGGIAVNKAVILQGVALPQIGCASNTGMNVTAGATIEGFSFVGGGSCPNGISHFSGGAMTVRNNTITGYNAGIVAWVSGDHIGPDNSVSAGFIGINSHGVGNVVDDNYVGSTTSADIALQASSNALVTDNDLTGASLAVGIDVSAVTGSTITGNTISGHTIGVQVGGLSSGNVIHDNSIVGNTQGIVNSAAAPVDATENWWGAASGPGGWGIGSGDTTGSNVDFFPWYTNAARTTMRTCDQTLGAPGSLYGTGGSDVMCGSSGDDLIYGRGGKDLLLGKGGHDHLYGRAGNDALIGGMNNDNLYGNQGFDSIQGRAGTDACFTGGGGGQTQSC